MDQNGGTTAEIKLKKGIVPRTLNSGTYTLDAMILAANGLGLWVLRESWEDVHHLANLHVESIGSIG